MLKAVVLLYIFVPYNILHEIVVLQIHFLYNAQGRQVYCMCADCLRM